MRRTQPPRPGEISVREMQQQLRHFGAVTRDLPSVRGALRVDEPEAHRILDRLARVGYVQRDPNRPEELCWRRTAAGEALARDGLGPPLSRARAERMLQRVLERAAEINRKPHYLCRVVTVGVFGAYLTDAPILDCLDLVVRIAPKPPTPGSPEAVFRPDLRLPYWKLQKSLPRPEWPHWRERHVELALVTGTRNVVLHACDDPLLRGQRVRLVFLAPPEPPASPPQTSPPPDGPTGLPGS